MMNDWLITFDLQFMIYEEFLKQNDKMNVRLMIDC